jgi:hypothetical protein
MIMVGPNARGGQGFTRSHLNLPVGSPLMNTIQLSEENRDDLIDLLEEHKKLAWALTKVDDPKWSTTVALTNEDAGEGEDPFVDITFGNEAISTLITARFNEVVEKLRLQGVVIHQRPAVRDA